MSEADPVVPTPPPATVGERLRFAREAQGLALDEVAARTRVPLRHLSAIELGDYSALPSVTYAVGFVRAYARVVGQDEVALSRDARVEVDRTVRPVKPYEPYAMADPARVPSRGLVIAATGIALAVLVLAILWLGTGMMRSDTAPAMGAAATAPVVAAVPAVQPRPAQLTGGQVRLTATDEVWMRVYDAKNGTLYLGTMKPGETFDVPPTAEDPMINVGRPDKLTVTLNGSAVPPLGTGERAIKDVRIGGPAISARMAGTPEPATVPAVSAPRTPQSDASVPPAFRQPSPSAASPSVDTGGAQTPPGASAPTTDAGDAAQ